MARSDARTVKEYLAELPPDRREVVEKVRRVILDNLPRGYREAMSYGMISFEVPLDRYPDTYNGQPLSYLALAAQKHHYAVYAHGIYMDPDGEAWLEEEFQKAGMRLDMGKSCIRFRKLENVPLEVIGKVAASLPVEEFLVRYEAVKRR